jgi:flagellar motor switch protein FliG
VADIKTLDPEVEYALLSGLDRAAILMSSLGASPARLIFKHMKDNDVKR